DLGEAAEVDGPGIGTGPGHHQLGVVLAAELGHLVEVNLLGVPAHAVVDDPVELAREVQVHAVGQVPAMRQVHGQQRVARLQTGEIAAHVGLGAGVRLDVGMLGPEQAADPFDGQALYDVDVFAAAVVAPAGVA